MFAAVSLYIFHKIKRVALACIDGTDKEKKFVKSFLQVHLIFALIFVFFAIGYNVVVGEKVGDSTIGWLMASAFCSATAIAATLEFSDAIGRFLRLKSYPKGRLLDALLPPDEAEHRFLEMDIAFERWVVKYGFGGAKTLYVWQSLITICLFWFDRVVVKVFARK